MRPPLFLLVLNIYLVNPSPLGCSELIPCFKSITEMIEMLSGIDSERYDCSSKTRSEWYETGETRVGWGVYYIGSGLLFQLIAWPVLHVFLSRNQLTSMFKVFKVMGFIGIIESTEIWGVSIWPGWAALNGEVYCTSPRLATMFGKITMVQWITGTTSAIFLGFHRLSELTKKGDWLHNTPLKTVCWLCVFTVYGVFGSVFYDTVLFNSVYMAPLLDPQIGTPRSWYSNEFLTIHNCLASLLLILIYTLLTVVWFKKNRSLSNWQKGIERRVLIQSICISLTYVIPALSFVLIYFIDSPPQWLVLLSDLSYQLSGGLPFIMYICINKKVRFELLKLFGLLEFHRNKTHPSTITVSTFTCSHNVLS